MRDAGGTLVYVLGVGVGAQTTAKRVEEFHADFPDVVYLSMAELFGGPLLTEFSRSLTRARVLQYQRYFSDADRVLILLHNDPDPDAMASGLALRNVLHRTRTTAIIGAIQGVTRPENLRMLNLLDIHVEAVTPASVKEYSRVAMVDVQPHYFGGLIDRADLVIDHHPEQPGYTAVFKDIRADYGSTCTILTEHLRAVDIDISERTATAMLYAIKSDTLFFNRQTNRVDIEAFSYLYPLADAALIRKMEGAEITTERLGYVVRAHLGGSLVDQVFCAFLGPTEREDFIPYVADFFLQMEHVKWTSSPDWSTRRSSSRCGTWATRRTRESSSGATSRTSAMPAGTGPWQKPSSRCGRSWRSSARSRRRSVGARLQEVVTQFLHEAAAAPEKKRETVKST